MSDKQPKRWSASVTQHSHALELKKNVFTLSDPYQLAMSLKRSAEHSRRRKGTPLQSAMSMLNFYINRAGSALSVKRKRTLTHAKEELRQAFNEPARPISRGK